MKNTKILIELDEMPDIHELMEMDEIRRNNSKSYIMGEMDESKVGKWMRILYELEEAGTLSIEEIGAKAFDSYIKGRMDDFQADKWIQILTELAEFVNREMRI